MMLGDNQRDKDAQRNNFIFIILMSVLAISTWYLFPPPNRPAAPAGAPVTAGAPATPGQPVAPAAATPATPVEAAPALATLIYDPAQGPAQEILLSNANPEGTTGLDLVFTDVGARLKQGTVHVVHGQKQPLVPTWVDVPDSEAVYPLGLEFQDEFLGDYLNKVRWTPEKSADGLTLTFRVDLPEPYLATITKTFSLASTETPNVLDVQVSYTNNSPQARLLGLDTEPAYSLFWAPNVHSGDEANKMSHQEIVWREGTENIHFPTSKLTRPADGTYSKVMLAPDWVAIKSAFFIVAMKSGFDGGRGWTLGDPHHFEVALDVPRTEVPAGGADARSFKIYLGPLQGDSLAKAWPGLKTSLQFFTMFGIMDSFAKGMLYVLNWFYHTIIANYGFAIIFLTILVRTAMFPLTLKGMKSMKKMQKLAPEMEEIKKEIGDDQQELQKRMMELYRERGVNPLGGCMPMLLQMPVFIALYRVYATAFEFRGAPFVGWITDLSKPDAFFHLPFTVPMPFTANGIDTFNLLPFLMGGAMVMSTKLMPTSGPVQNPQQKMMMTLMPIFFSAICYNMASGLNLYILTSTLLGIVQNYFVHVSDEELKAKSGSAPKKKARPKHFYAAAQARKREMAREERRGKKKGPRGKDSGKD
jgi:YidC/Oxa1 family membrane protein insertase